MSGKKIKLIGGSLDGQTMVIPEENNEVRNLRRGEKKYPHYFNDIEDTLAQFEEERYVSINPGAKLEGFLISTISKKEWINQKVVQHKGKKQKNNLYKGSKIL